jgi:serine/threonine protein kinase
MGANVSANNESDKISSEICRKKLLYISTIGWGRFGKIYKAFEGESGTWCAVKEINLDMAMQERHGIDRLFAEISSLKKLGVSPFTVGLKCAFKDENKCYLVLDLVSCGNLRYHIDNKVIFSEKDIAFIIACLSSAVHHIHQNDIIHRNIKPENIIFGSNGYPYLTDFGESFIAEPLINDVTCTLTRGTPQYMAPEIFTKSHCHDRESDFWSIGIVLYELVFGNVPFESRCPDSYVKYIEHECSPATSGSTKKTIDISIAPTSKGSKASTYALTTAQEEIALSNYLYKLAVQEFSRWSTDGSGTDNDDDDSDDCDGKECNVESVIIDKSMPQVNIPNESKIRYAISRPCKDLIKRLLQVDPSHRLGVGINYVVLQSHPFFSISSICFDRILNMTYTPKFFPTLNPFSYAMRGGGDRHKTSDNVALDDSIRLCKPVQSATLSDVL